MKKTALALLIVLLSGCASTTQQVNGQVVSCSGLHSFNSENPLELGCLDGSQGVAINAVHGPMIINVWGSWCGPCKEEMPIFRSFYKKLGGQLQLVGVDVEEASIKDGQSFVVTHGMTWPNIFDADGQSRADFGMGVPVTWFISANGEVAYKHIGVLKSEIELITLTSRYLGVKL